MHMRLNYLNFNSFFIQVRIFLLIIGQIVNDKLPGIKLKRMKKKVKNVRNRIDSIVLCHKKTDIGNSKKCK